MLAPDGVGGIEFRAETGGGGGAHPNLASHDALGLATDAELAAHVAAGDPHTGYATDADLTAHGATPGHSVEASLTFEFGPGAVVNDYRLVPIPWNFTPVGWRIIGDVAGACSIDLWMDVFANGQPTNADSITASATPAVAATNISASSTTLTGWDTTWVKGDLLKVVIEALTTMTQVTIEIYGNRT